MNDPEAYAVHPESRKVSSANTPRLLNETQKGIKHSRVRLLQENNLKWEILKVYLGLVLKFAAGDKFHLIQVRNFLLRL